MSRQYDYDEEIPRHHEHIDIVKNHNHHGDHASKYWIFWGFCLFITLIIVIVLIIGSTNWWKVDHHWTETQSEINKLKQQMSAATTHNDKIYLLSDVFQSNMLTPLSLCYLQLYYTLTDKSNESLRVLKNPSQHILNELEYYYYALDIKINIYFNIDKKNNPFDEIEIDNDDKYMSLDFNIKTSYNKFSTMKLVEIGLDSNNNIIKSKRETIICSNNNIYKSKKRCDLVNSDNNQQNDIQISYTKLLNMFIDEQQKNSYTRKLNNNKNNNKNNDDDDSSVRGTPIPSSFRSHPTSVAPTKEEYEIDYNIKKSSSSNIIKNTNNLNDIRIFTIILYKEDHKQINNTKVSRLSQHNFKESVLLTIELNKCN